MQLHNFLVTAIALMHSTYAREDPNRHGPTPKFDIRTYVHGGCDNDHGGDRYMKTFQIMQDECKDIYDDKRAHAIGSFDYDAYWGDSGEELQTMIGQVCGVVFWSLTGCMGTAFATGPFLERANHINYGKWTDDYLERMHTIDRGPGSKNGPKKCSSFGSGASAMSIQVLCAHTKMPERVVTQEELDFWDWDLGLKSPPYDVEDPVKQPGHRREADRKRRNITRN